MHITTQKIDGVLVAYISGALSSNTTGQAFDELARIAQLGEQSVILHLDRVESVSRAGARSILVAAKLLQNSGGKLIICAASPYVARSLSRTGFNHLIRRCADLKAALTEAQRSAGGERSDRRSEQNYRLAI